MMFDLLKTVEYGGCSAKIAADVLEQLLDNLNISRSANILVGNDTCDDAAVYKINEHQAIIFTTDFFPPVCSDAYTFGQIAAANAMSDVYAMGGQVLMALNLIMFPSKDIPLEILSEILRGGQDKVTEAGAFIVGGHTIDDPIPKYGLAVVGLIDPEQIITNATAHKGDALILTKPLGIGTISAGHRLNLTQTEHYEQSLALMKQLNKDACQVMKKYQVKTATDITGFGLLGHAIKLAKASQVTINIDADKVPFIDGAMELVEQGCIPGASFRNQKYVEADDSKHYINLQNASYEKRMLLYDAQTSGGMLMCVEQGKVSDILRELREFYPTTAVIGEVNA